VITNFSNTLASARSTAMGNGRGLDNASAKACQDLGYKVDEASTSSKFVQVSGSVGTALVGFYGGYGGFQVEVPAAAKEEFISVLKSRGVKAEQAYGTKAPRVAIGSDKAALAVALEVVCGKVGKVVREEPKAQEVPASPVAMVAPGLDLTAIVTAALAAGKSQQELLELIAALKA
jgi:hypothetical protein